MAAFKIISYIIFSGFIISKSFAQIGFQKISEIQIFNPSVAINNIEATHGNGLSIVGTTGKVLTDNVNERVFIQKMDSVGNTEWAKAYGYVAYSLIGYDMLEQNNNFMITGSVKQIPGKGSVLFNKTDDTGKVIWTKAYDHPNDGFGRAIKTTLDGGYIMVGESDNTTISDILILKTDDDGTLLWSRSIGTTEQDRGYNVIQTPDSNFFITGFSGSANPAGSSYPYNNADVCLIKCSNKGDVLFKKKYSFPGDTTDVAFALTLTNDNKILISGESSSPVGSGGKDILIIKTDLDGNVEWSKLYGGLLDDGSTGITLSLDGSIICSGYTWNGGAGLDDHFVLKLDNDGNIVWAKAFGGASFDHCKGKIVNTVDGGLAFTGFSKSFSGISSWQTAYTIKMDQDGNAGECNNQLVDILVKDVVLSIDTVVTIIYDPLVETNISLLTYTDLGYVDSVVCRKCPEVGFVSDSSICLYDSISLYCIKDNFQYADVLWQWNYGDDLTIDSSVNCTDHKYRYEQPGEYTIELVYSDQFCSDTISQTLSIYEVPHITFGPYDTFTMVTETLILAPDIEGEVIQYNWSPAEELSCIDCPYPIASPSDTTTYYITVVNEYGCSATAHLTLYVKEKKVNDVPDYNFFMPNTFSPNGDGINDQLKWYIKDYTSYLLKIFDKTGKQVFETNSLNYWDGISSNNNNSLEKTYMYSIILTRLDNQVDQYSGNIILLR